MSKKKWEMRYFRYATASLSLPRLRRTLLSITKYRRLRSNHDKLRQQGPQHQCRGRQRRCDRAGRKSNRSCPAPEGIP